MNARNAAFPLLVLTIALSTLACLGSSSPQETIGLSKNQGQDLLTADASSQTALETKVAARAGAPVLDLLDVGLTQQGCAPHPNTQDGYDCTFTAEFSFAYETADLVRAQCFLSNAESEKVNVSPGAGQMTLSATYASLFYSPGTGVAAFCQLRALSDDAWLAEDFIGEGPYDEAFLLPVP